MFLEKIAIRHRKSVAYVVRHFGANLLRHTRTIMLTIGTIVFFFFAKMGIISRQNVQSARLYFALKFRDKSISRTIYRMEIQNLEKKRAGKIEI